MIDRASNDVILGTCLVVDTHRTSTIQPEGGLIYFAGLSASQCTIAIYNIHGYARYIVVIEYISMKNVIYDQYQPSNASIGMSCISLNLRA